MISKMCCYMFWRRFCILRSNSSTILRGFQPNVDCRVKRTPMKWRGRAQLLRCVHAILCSSARLQAIPHLQEMEVLVSAFSLFWIFLHRSCSLRQGSPALCVAHWFRFVAWLVLLLCAPWPLVCFGCCCGAAWAAVGSACETCGLRKP